MMAVPASDEQRHWGKWWEGHNNDILNSFWRDTTHNKSIQTYWMPILIKPHNKHIKDVADRRAHTEVCRSLRICCTVLYKKNRFNCSSKIIVLWCHSFATVMEKKTSLQKIRTTLCHVLVVKVWSFLSTNKYFSWKSPGKQILREVDVLL